MDLSPAALLELLVDKGEQIAPEAASKGFDAVLDEMDGFLGDIGGAELQEDGAAVLGILKENKAPFMRLSAEGFARVLGHFANGEEELAENHYISTQATFAERRRWMQEGGDALAKETAEKAAAWAAVKATLQKVVTKGLPIALKLAAKVLGIPLPF
jgi:hypothetical protein